MFIKHKTIFSLLVGRLGWVYQYFAMDCWVSCCSTQPTNCTSQTQKVSAIEMVKTVKIT